VIWTQQHRFGVSTEEQLDINAVVGEPDRSAAPQPARGTSPAAKRSGCREHAVAFGRSRERSRINEFGLIVICGATAAVLAYSTIVQAFAWPISLAQAALTRG
jgi:hypothetical protein